MKKIIPTAIFFVIATPSFNASATGEEGVTNEKVEVSSGTLTKCTQILSKGHTYKISIDYLIDKKGSTPYKPKGQFNISDDAEQLADVGRKSELDAFFKCIKQTVL